VQEVEAGLEVLAGTIRNEPRVGQLTMRNICAIWQAHLSPYIRGRFRLGLAVGVRSLTRPACSSCSRAFDSIDESTGSEFRSCVLEPKADLLRLCVAVGGVLDSGGEISVGVAIPLSACAATSPTASISSLAMAMVVLCCNGQYRAFTIVLQVDRSDRNVGGSRAANVEALAELYTGRQ
jgi:hypothetical protein